MGWPSRPDIGTAAIMPGDPGVWVIASALEYGLARMSHDGLKIALAREPGLPVFTANARYTAGNPR
jgi:hypothetical protein